MHPYSRQTINQLLAEMDGSVFSQLFKNVLVGAVFNLKLCSGSNPMRASLLLVPQILLKLWIGKPILSHPDHFLRSICFTECNLTFCSVLVP